MKWTVHCIFANMKVQCTLHTVSPCYYTTEGIRFVIKRNDALNLHTLCPHIVLLEYRVCNNRALGPAFASSVLLLYTVGLHISALCT